MFKVLEGGFEPVRGTKYSAYVDLFAREDVTIGAGETKIVKLGIKLDLSLIQTAMAFDSLEMKEFMQSHYLEVALRSSLGVKGLIIANGIGVIDLDYEGELGLIVHNPIQMVSTEPIECGDEYVDITLTGSSYGCDENVKSAGRITIKKGDKVAQCTLKEHKGFLMGYESDIARSGGFGSTGK